MIYELFGLPGSGKTTFCNELYKNKKIKNLMSLYKENFWGKIYFHFYLKCMVLFKNEYGLYKKIINELKESDIYINKIDKNININLYIKYLLFVNMIERRVINKKITYIVDEGVIHYCIAMMAEFSLSLEKVNKLLDIINFKTSTIKPVGLKCNIDTCLQHIEKRNRKETPIDFLEKVKLINLLNDYQNAYDIFINKYKEIEK